jgi:hypothetical protein
MQEKVATPNQEGHVNINLLSKKTTYNNNIDNEQPLIVDLIRVYYFLIITITNKPYSHETIIKHETKYKNIKIQ